MKRAIKATMDSTVSEREKKNAVLSKETAEEGMVLLTNAGGLPLEEREIFLFGVGARHTAFGGTGSGENRPRYKVNIEQGLINNGFTVLNKEYLDEYDTLYEASYQAWKKQTKEALKKVNKLESLDYTSSHPFFPPEGRDLKEDELPSGQKSAAVYILTRKAGEGCDRLLAKGDYFITDEELAFLKRLKACFSKLILVLNVGAVMDLSFLKEVQPSAVLLLMQAGMETGNALGEVLAGKKTPSGKLADTWGEKYEDYPSSSTFSYLKGDPTYEEYKEGILVGYRFFDAEQIKPLFPFGFGLSYADFQLNYSDIKLEGSSVTVSFQVSNTSQKYAGKEVVQVYLSCPEGKLKKEVKSLVGFKKTPLLTPGEKSELTISFDLKDSASYDEKSASYILEKGIYYVLAGNSSASLTPVCSLTLNEDIITEKLMNICTLKSKLEEIEIPVLKREFKVSKDFVIDPQAFKTKTIDYTSDLRLGGEEVEKIIARLKDKDLAHLVVGTSYLGVSHHTVFGAGGYTTSKFYSKGIDNMPMSDGPQGLNVTPVAKKQKQNFVNTPALPEALTGGLLGKILKEPKVGTKGCYYQYMTAWPCETEVAQTWNEELMENIGRATGEEMEEIGLVFWLAPAMNIHRNPLCGRNYEYYSEDPLLSGKTAASVTKGVQSIKGKYVTLKHFACNNLETKRNKSNSILSERALREIYLKGFKIGVEEGGAKGIMSSYNLINGVYSPNNHDLLTDALRYEWGFKGLVMTDWFATGHDTAYSGLGVLAGNDLIMPGIPKDVKEVEKALKEKKITRQDLEISARRIIALDLEAYR